MLQVGCQSDETEAVLAVPITFSNKVPGSEVRFSVGRGDSPVFPLSKTVQMVGVLELFRFPGAVKGPFVPKDEDVSGTRSLESKDNITHSLLSKLCEYFVIVHTFCSC